VIADREKGDLAVGGFLRRAVARRPGALLIGYDGDDGQRLIYAGTVGTGYMR
jgi:hypothetical protein